MIGAGMGALAAAARLATGGHRVTVYERAATYGGGVGRYEREGFRFDTGPGLLHLPAVYRDLFIKTGRETLERSVELVQVDPSSRHVLPDGAEVSLPNASRAGVVAALDSAFGTGCGERWGELLNRAREVWEATRRPLLEEALLPGRAPLAGDPYPAPPVRRGLFRRTPPTLAETAARELRTPGLVTLLEHYALAYGYDPRTAPSSATVLAYLEQTFGTWYVRGGMRALAEAVYERCLARGVEFRFGAEVTAVVEKDGRTAGIELADGERVEADSVVAGAPVPPPRERRIVPWTDQDEWPAPGRAGAARLVVCLALRGARPADAAHRTVVHADDGHAEADAVFGGGRIHAGRPTVTVLRPDDPALRPDGEHEAVTLSAAVPPAADDASAGAQEAYEALADRMVTAAEAAVPALRERLLWRHVHTPVDAARETGSPGGAVPGPALAGAGSPYPLAANRSAMPGLYFVGGWAHPGGGLAHTGMSGAIVADLISGGPGGSR